MGGLQAEMRTWVRTNAVENTKKTYKTYQNQYLKYCNSHGYSENKPEVVCAFLKEGMEQRKLTASTLNGVAACAIADMFKFDKVKPTQDPLVLAAKRIISRKAKKGPGGKKPLPRDMLVKFTKMAQASNVKDTRDVLMFILMFGGMLRECEAAALKASDVWVHEGNLYILVEKSKTDQTGLGATVVLAGCAGSVLCPVSWFEAYSAVRPKGLFLFHNTAKPAEKLSAKRPNGILKEWLARAGVPEDERALFGSHSLRKGGATKAASQQVRMHVLKRHGRWKSDAVYLYIVDSPNEQLEVSRAVLGFN